MFSIIETTRFHRLFPKSSKTFFEYLFNKDLGILPVATNIEGTPSTLDIIAPIRESSMMMTLSFLSIFFKKVFNKSILSSETSPKIPLSLCCEELTKYFFKTIYE